MYQQGGDALVEHYIHLLKGTRWITLAGELVLQQDFRFFREHGFPQAGKWEIDRPNILWLRADDDTDRTKAEAFSVSEVALRTCAPNAGGFDYRLSGKQ